MRREFHVRFCEGPGVQSPRATRLIVHCATERKAEDMRGYIERRLQQCKLQLHPEKTRIVCCDMRGDRRRVSSFDFLGFRFRPRLARARSGQIFATYGPGISPKAVKRMRTIVRREWHLPTRTGMSLAELAKMMNPVLKGWIGYYGRFRPSALAAALRTVTPAVCMWVGRKFKRFKDRGRKAADWLHRISVTEPGLFAHWEAFPNLRPLKGRARRAV